MRIVAYGFLIGVSSLLASPLAGVPTSLIIQGGALAILGWAVWYMLAKAFPASFEAARKERAVFLEAQKKEREDFLEELQDTRREFRESLVNIAGSMDTLTASLCQLPRR